jgi:hypothetical protein
MEISGQTKVRWAEGVLLSVWISLAIAVFFLSGCSRFRGAFGRAQHRSERAQKGVDQDTKQFVSATVDAAKFAQARLPTNAIADVANALRIGIKYGEMAQRGVGLPVERIDVLAEVHGDKKAVEAARKLEAASALRIETRDAMADAELARLKALAELGAKYEKEHNQSIVKRTWHWLIATFGIGGVIALCVFFPAIIPIIGRVLGWIVGKIPALAGAIGVVATRAYDRVVGSVELAKRQNTVVGHVFENIASRKMDQSEKDLVVARKPVVVEAIAKKEAAAEEANNRVEKAIQETEQIEPRKAGLPARNPDS